MGETAENNAFLSSIQGNIKFVDVNQHLQQYSINSENSPKWVEMLKKHFLIEKMENNVVKIKVTDEVLKQIVKYLANIQSTSLAVTSEELTTVVIELYRSLRNCATNEHAQNYLAFQTDILQVTRTAIETNKKNNLCIKIILQFLINLITSNRTVTQILHEKLFDVLLNLTNEGVVTYECSALFYNFSLFMPLEINIVNTMLKLWNENNENEFLLFFIENCISSNQFWNIYNDLLISHRLVILELLRSQQIKDKHYTLPNSGINTLITNFLGSPKLFFKINNITEWEEIREVSVLLEIISSLSSKDEYIIVLQENKNLVVTAAALLINFHRLGKEGNNLFTPIQKLSENEEEVPNNPIFGLKADLIRLIGNMCWKNLSLQNLAREAEVIPVILDCCNIDSKNPFITQWSIFAIRNLCKNNLENQKVISGLHQKGTVPSQVLDEFGIALHTDGENQIKIVSMDSLK